MPTWPRSMASNPAAETNKSSAIAVASPDDFMFVLSAEEKAEVIANCDHLSRLKFSKSLPFAFTEHGAIQAANVLASPQAIEMGRSLSRFRAPARTGCHAQGTGVAPDNLEQSTEAMAAQHDQFARNTRAQLKQVFDAIRELMTPPEPPKKRPIGFITSEEKTKKDS